ncbi:MAG: hypothetical protein ABR953_08975 [Candidatus Acidiferrales bacterium]|jgi:hypothetical protein
MADLDLRPLSLGEILDRTFSLYRRNFLLFLGITALPHLLILALNLVRTFPAASPAATRRVVVLGQPQVSASTGFMAVGFVGLMNPGGVIRAAGSSPAGVPTMFS